MQSPSPLITTIVNAGAGTGKTESLSRRIIQTAQYLHSQGLNPRIVATTFTERATAELRERILTLLGQQTDVPQWLHDWARDPHRLHISTIDGIFSLVLHRYGVLIDLDPEFTIINSFEERKIISQVLRQIFSEFPNLAALLETYSFNEIIEITAQLIPVYQSTRDNFRVPEGWEKILEDEFKNIQGLVQELRGASKEGLPPSVLKFLEDMAPLEKLSGSNQARYDAFNEIISEIRKPSVSGTSKAAPLKAAIDRLFEGRDLILDPSYNPALNIEHDLVSQTVKDLVEKAAERISTRKQLQGVLTFSDLQFLTQELIARQPQAVREIQETWDFWFVDEFQDTSPVQKRILFSFFRNPKNAYFVGDPQQSIYLFRDADENVFQETLQMVADDKGEVSSLDTNYRSHPDLLRFLNHLFGSMKPPMKLLEAKGPAQGEIRAEMHYCEEEVTENQAIFAQIIKWQDLGHALHDVAILVRTNDQARKVARYLANKKVDVFVHASGGFYDRREIIDALALLNLLEDPSHDDLFVLLCRSPWFGVDDATLAQWGRQRQKKSFIEFLLSQEGVVPSEMATFMEALKEASRLPLSAVFEKTLERLGFFEFCLIGDSSGRREANLRKLVGQLKAAERSAYFSASEFLSAQWKEQSEIGEEKEAASFIEPKRVNIMTVHKSKGLKFDCVIVPGCGDYRISPSRSLIEKAQDGRFAVKVVDPQTEEKVSPIVFKRLKEERSEREFQESLRVFYVAITRAAERLSLITKSEPHKNSWLGRTVIFKDDLLFKTTIWKELVESAPLRPEVEESVEAPIFSLAEPKGVLERVSVSTLAEDLQEIRQLPLRVRLESQQRGQLIHFLFESLKQSPDASIKEMVERASKRFVTRWPIDEKSLAKTLTLQTPPLKDLIQSGFTEWPFSFMESGQIVSGQIDLWGTVDNATWIVDYKTAKELTPEALNRAQIQLETYALAVCKSGVNWEKIKLCIVAPLLGESVLLPLSSFEDVITRLGHHLSRLHPLSKTEAPD